MLRIFLILQLLISAILRSQTCTTLVAYDYVETYNWTGVWWGNSLNSGYYTNAAVSSTRSAAIYGTGGGSSAIEQDWYTLPNLVGLNSAYTYSFKFRLGSYVFTGPTATTRGVDSPDLVELQVSTDGAVTYTSEIRITGNNNATWDYNTSGIITKTASGTLTAYSPTTGGVRTSTGDGYSIITLTLSGITQLAIDILCRANANGEEWWLDNMELYEIAPCAPLPVELSSFTGVAFNKYNQLTWITLTENNNNRFEVERSEDAQVWSKIGIILASVDGLQGATYEYLDYEFIKDKINYYRLKQIDNDGNFKYLGIIAVTSKKNKKLISIISLDGKNITPEHRGIIIEWYDDGSYEKKIQY